jgi:hypothetical protein
MAHSVLPHVILRNPSAYKSYALYKKLDFFIGQKQKLPWYRLSTAKIGKKRKSAMRFSVFFLITYKSAVLHKSFV